MGFLPNAHREVRGPPAGSAPLLLLPFQALGQPETLPVELVNVAMMRQTVQQRGPSAGHPGIPGFHSAKARFEVTSKEALS